jgi:hypothetical protein
MGTPNQLIADFEASQSVPKVAAFDVLSRLFFMGAGLGGNVKHAKSQASFLALAGLVAVTATIGLSACGKFEIDPKFKGVSTNSNPLKSEEEDKIRSLVSASPTPPTSPYPSGDGGGPAGARRKRTGETGDAALDQVRRLFDEELSAPGAPAAPAPATAAAPAAPAAAPAPAEQAPDTAAAPAAPAAAPAPVEQTPAALIAQELSDEAKGQLLFELVEPTMRINFRISLQRNEILAMKKILDEKKELSREQQEKLAHFKRSFLLVPGDSIEALLSRVDVIAFTIQVAPLLLETNWGTKGKITAEALSNRAQKLNTHPTDDAVRFRSGRLALKGSNRTDISRQVYAAELGYNPEEGKIESLEPLRLTQMEVERVMRSPGISTRLDNQIKKMTAQMIQEFSK